MLVLNDKCCSCCLFAPALLYSFTLFLFPLPLSLLFFVLLFTFMWAFLLASSIFLRVTFCAIFSLTLQDFGKLSGAEAQTERACERDGGGEFNALYKYNTLYEELRDTEEGVHLICPEISLKPALISTFCSVSRVRCADTLSGHQWMVHSRGLYLIQRWQGWAPSKEALVTAFLYGSVHGLNPKCHTISRCDSPFQSLVMRWVFHFLLWTRSLVWEVVMASHLGQVASLPHLFG